MIRDDLQAVIARPPAWNKLKLARCTRDQSLAESRLAEVLSVKRKTRFYVSTSGMMAKHRAAVL